MDSPLQDFLSVLLADVMASRKYRLRCSMLVRSGPDMMVGPRGERKREREREERERERDG